MLPLPPTNSYPCPVCRATATLAANCPGCGRAPDPLAAEVIRLDGEIAGLTGRVEQARQAYLTLAATLRDHQQRRQELAARVRVGAYVSRPTGVPTPRPGPSGVPAPALTPAVTGVPTPAVAGVPGRPAAAPVRPETSTRTVQNLLFILGGLLLGTAAIVFTVVAWATVGIVGRAVILAVVTLLALAAPLLAKRRGLTATGETFAAVGLLLVLLDGYAAWSVDLFGVADWPGVRYTAVVGVVGVVVAAGYGSLTRLAVPWFAALLVAQPVPLLLASDADLAVAGWSLTFAALAALNLAVVWRVRGGGVALAGRIAAWVAYGLALLASTVCGLVALVVAEGPLLPDTALLAGVPLLVAVLLMVAGSVLARNTVLQLLAGCASVLALAGAATRPAVELPGSPLLPGALIVVVLALLVMATARLLPAGVRLGPRIGGLIVFSALAASAGFMTCVVAGATVFRSLPVWRADVSGGTPFDWQLPVAVVLATVALVTLLPRGAWMATAVGGAGFVALALPAAGLPWWAVPVVDLAVGVGLLLVVLRRRPAAGLVAAGSAAVLVGHAVLVGLARPVSATAVLAVVLSAGLAVAATARVGSTVERAIGGSALAVGLLAGPAASTVGLFTAGVGPQWQARGGTAAVALLVGALVAVRRWWPAYLPYAAAALAVAVLGPGLLPTVDRAGEPQQVYAAVAVLLVAIGLSLVRPVRSAVPLLVSGGVLLLAAAVLLLPAGLAVLAGPYAWLAEIWSGVPAGVGLTPFDRAPAALARWVNVPTSIALVVLTVAALVCSVTVQMRRTPDNATAQPGTATSTRPPGWQPSLLRPALLPALPFATTTVLVGLAASGARWPVVPAVALLGGLACLLTAALAASLRRSWAVGLVVPLGLVLAGPGLAGLLPAKASTLAGLGVIVAVATVAGAVGRTVVARTAGWLTAVVSALILAVAASLAVDLPLRLAAFAVLGVAVLALVVGAVLRGRRPVESVAVDALGHAGAVIALLFSMNEHRYAAAVCTLWGLVVGLRALRPGEPARYRWTLAGVAAGSELFAVWLLLAAAQVAVLEAYTLPAAALAVVAGWLANRAQPALNSWLTYGPGLAAGLLPTLVSVLVADGQPWRRLLLGVAALATVLVGARWRRQAPVLLGGGTLALVALHEVGGVWDRLPRWIFLAIGGFALIGLAITYERRRRDLARLRAAVRRMT
ncbi:hypothetical protein GCM10027290_67680 [Micromonospora sonneratiae]|uniref:SCO7613 C-terminal domain-containing membrane protein n=1 Tax=Micromonospora sonneratiae TaxID=1184706 RepID=UPI00366E4B8A